MTLRFIGFTQWTAFLRVRLMISPSEKRSEIQGAFFRFYKYFYFFILS
jgi:hypothetical protein